ncbi:MAG: hypothetical protein P8J14_01475 [Emcibacteraceae bacterium]|nr:hypothetical protein [Emcibacteraceae bacterium]
MVMRESELIDSGIKVIAFPWLFVTEASILNELSEADSFTPYDDILTSWLVCKTATLPLANSWSP